MRPAKVVVLERSVRLSPKQKEECRQYESLVKRMSVRQLTRAEIEFLDKHENTCLGRHSARAHERALGLTLGALDPGGTSDPKKLRSVR